MGYRTTSKKQGPLTPGEGEKEGSGQRLQGEQPAQHFVYWVDPSLPLSAVFGKS